jgi:hypothetical protein
MKVMGLLMRNRLGAPHPGFCHKLPTLQNSMNL